MDPIPAFQGHGYLFEAAHVMACLDSGKKQSDILPWSFSEDLIETIDLVRESAQIKF